MKIVNAGDLPASFFQYRDLPEAEGVKAIIAQVRDGGDGALKELTQRFDGAEVADFAVDGPTIEAAYRRVEKDTIAAIDAAAENLRLFAEAQRRQLADFSEEVRPGVQAGQRIMPIDRVGVYVPGGVFPLVSTLLMGVVPALVAGVPQISVCSPPGYAGEIHPVILVAAHRLGIKRVFRMGGAQAIAAFAYGTESIEAVDKIVGPGNKYVAQAKKEVFGRVGIDLIAGPTEVLILADEDADPEWLAADLLAQAEHDPEACALLVTTSPTLAEQVSGALANQLPRLKTAAIAGESLQHNGMIILAKDLGQAVELVNRKAPEHLEIQLKNPGEVLGRLRNYGSLFVGEYSAEVLGDYSAGINHTLPTNTTARYRGGLSVFDFVKVLTSLEVTGKGLREIGPVAEKLAEAEGLDAHRRAVAIRRGQQL
ncbi:MAG: histidinol dehydrogenase [Calditrichaeota bacterium]|nr:histidinol dehydrogenase [Calditrichota bacterium]